MRNRPSCQLQTSEGGGEERKEGTEEEEEKEGEVWIRRFTPTDLHRPGRPPLAAARAPLPARATRTPRRRPELHRESPRRSQPSAPGRPRSEQDAASGYVSASPAPPRAPPARKERGEGGWRPSPEHCEHRPPGCHSFSRAPSSFPEPSLAEYVSQHSSGLGHLGQLARGVTSWPHRHVSSHRAERWTQDEGVWGPALLPRDAPGLFVSLFQAALFSSGARPQGSPLKPHPPREVDGCGGGGGMT